MTSFVPFRRAKRLAALTLTLLLGLGIAVAHAHQRRSERAAHTRAHEAVARLAGTSDLALSSTARWLRHPSLSESGASAADLPASLDVDPAGALIAPPIELMHEGGVDLVSRP